MGIFRKQIWKNSEENSEKINRGDPFLKNLPWGTKGKNLKKNFEKEYIFIKSFGIYGLYNRNFFGKFWKKKFWKKNLRFFPLVPPYLKKPTLGDQRKKSEKKILKKNIFLLKVSGYMVYIIDFFWKILKKKIWSKNLRFFPLVPPYLKKPTLWPKEKIWKKNFEKKIHFYEKFRDIWFI